MDEIKELKRPFINLFFKAFLLLILSCIALQASGQEPAKGKKEKRKVELIHADTYKPDDVLGRELVKSLGNVAFKHNEIIMTCDSSWFYPGKDQIKAFSRVHVEQGDTLDIYGDYLFYDGSSEMAFLEGNVLLIDKETRLYTSSVDYDVKNKVARYTNNGRITDGDNTLTSKLGTYHTDQKMFNFKDSIVIVNKDYVMRADTMDYNTETETVFFRGPAEVKGDSLYVYCEAGWHDTKNDISRIWKNAVIDNLQQIIKGDSLYYEGKDGMGEAFFNVSITDTTNDVTVTGEYARYFKDPERFMVTRKATFIQSSKEDSLFMHSDTISVITVTIPETDTTTLSYRIMRSWHNCRVFSTDLQAKCDSLSYSFRDSVIRLYYEPVIWSENNQLTSDSMAIFTRNRSAERMELYNKAFVTSMVDSARYDQIKGRNLTGYFREWRIYLPSDRQGNACWSNSQ